MSDRYGIVYMGSKEKMLNTINYIFQREYKKRIMIDLFAGGFSVSSYALQRTNFKVIANDLNRYVISLYREILSGGKNLEEVRYDWIDRKTFEQVRDFPHVFEEWYVGYVLNVWSFGCDQRSYLYAKDLEEDKKTLHMAIVFNDFSGIYQNEMYNGLIISQSIKVVDFKKAPTSKRIAFMNVFKRYIKSHGDSPYRDQLQRMTQMENISQMVHLDAIKTDIQFQDKLLLYSMDWQMLYSRLDKSVLENSFIYCDPPYESTKKYQFGNDFDYAEFWNWFRTCPYSIYVSSYTAPEDIKPINFTQKQVNMDNGNKSEDRKTKKKKAIENIYWNGKGKPEPTFLDQMFNGGV